MENNARLESHNRYALRLVLKGAVCLLLLLGLGAAATATTTITPAGSSAPAASASQTPALLRTRTPTLARPPSPTPTSTPVLSSRARALYAAGAPRLLPGQPDVDEYTVALYHFDSQNSNLAPDAAGLHDATLHGNAGVIGGGQYAGVLWVDGANSYARTGHLGDLGSGTLEMFIDFAPQCHSQIQAIFPIVSIGGEFGSNQPVALLRVDGYLNFLILVDGVWYKATSGINPCRYLAGGDTAPYFTMYNLPLRWPYEVWRYHHVAATWGPRGIEIWVDGALHGVGERVPADVDPFDPGSHTLTNACNPQAHVASASYPNCDHPRIGPVLGSYVGGMPTYSTFLIGCDSANACFKGRIDELRVSNVQRTFSAAVVPTSTPTPTQTPDRIGEYGVDSATLGLYHLNSQSYGRVVDEVGLHDGGLSGNAKIVANGHYNGAVMLDGSVSPDGYLTYVQLGDVGAPGIGMVEAWVYLTEAPPYFPIISTSNLHLGVHTSGGHTLRFGIFVDDDWVWADSGIVPTAEEGCWHHVAGTWGPRGMEIWVDGVLRGANVGFTGRPWPNTHYLIGCDTRGFCMKGLVDEVRVSSIQRTFSPVGLGIARAPTRTATRPVAASAPRLPRTPASAFQFYFPFVINEATPEPPRCVW